LYIIFKEYFVV